MIKLLITNSFMVVLCIPGLAFAQDDPQNVVTGSSIESSSDFRLFENVESNSSNTASAAEAARNNRNPNSRNTQAAPTFTLVGTSRFGDRHTALLKHMNGETVKVPLGDGINPVPGHDLYSVLQYGAGQVAIRYPAAVPCGDFPDQGVSCDSTTNIATLSLTTGEAIALAESVMPTDDSVAEVGDEVEEAADQNAPRNPFAALRDRSQQGDTAQPAGGRFQPRRISPEEVPPGYRVVSTPFGDRLVEQ